MFSEYYETLVKELVRPIVVDNMCFAFSREYIDVRCSVIALSIIDIQDDVYNDYLAFI